MEKVIMIIRSCLLIVFILLLDHCDKLTPSETQHRVFWLKNGCCGHLWHGVRVHQEEPLQ